MKEFLDWVTQSGTFLFNDEIYKQRNGMPMGGPASGLFADVLMNYIVDKAMGLCPSHDIPILFYRYVDECFAVFNIESSVEIFAELLHKIHPKYKIYHQENRLTTLLFFRCPRKQQQSYSFNKNISKTYSYWTLLYVEQFLTTMVH